MDTTIRRRIAGSAAFNSYRHAESVHIQEQGMEPNDLWQLLAFLQTICAAGQFPYPLVIHEVHKLAVKYQPMLRRK